MSNTHIPKAIRWRTLVLIAVVSLVAILIGVGFAGPLRSAIASAGHWVGFGHEHEDEAVAVTDDSGQVQYYTCGMHPWVILPEPGDCPICHMELTPIDPDKFTGEITIDPVIVQNMGVRVAPVVTGPLTKTIRTVGTIDYNERAVRDVNIKTPGWIEDLYVDFVGAKVEAGEPLFELYSPQLYAAQEEYLLALRSQGRVGSDLSPDATQGATDLLEAARTRLEYFDITDEQIKELERRGKPAKTMTIKSPHTGVVIAKHANEGMKVDPGMQAYRIADLSTVWAMVTLYEYQLPYVETGMKVTMSLSYLPGQTFEGEVIYIYPYLDKKTREVQVRLEFDNPTNLLKPGMFANVTLENTLAAEKTLAPRSAVIDTGERQVAFVSRGEGKFEPRDVRMGVETGDGMVQIISGLKPGEIVVTSGQFLIDSEAKMREALAKMIRGDLASEQQVTAEMAGASELQELPGPVAAKLTQALNHYMAMADALANDTTQGIADHAEQLATSLNELVKLEVPADPHLWHKHQDAIATARSNALKLINTNDLAEARLQFAQISISLESLLMTTGVPPTFEREVQVLHCPMYRKDQGGQIWLQPAGDVRNPYMGQQMLECFDERKALPVTGQKPEEKEETRAGEDSSASTPADSAGGDQAEVPTRGLQLMIDEVFAIYLGMHDQLASDSFDRVSDAVQRLDRIAELLGPRWQPVAAAIPEPESIKDLEHARKVFKEISKQLSDIATDQPPSRDVADRLFVANCPMAKGGLWLQKRDSVSNPYYGSAMPDCGSIESSIKTVEAPETGYYTCDKHPKIITAEPIECPIGGATLVPYPRSRFVDDALKGSSPGGAAQISRADSDGYPIDFCLISGEKLGSMGKPITMEYKGRTLKFCCRMCISDFQEDPDKYLKKLDEAAQTLGKTQGGR